MTKGKIIFAIFAAMWVAGHFVPKKDTTIYDSCMSEAKVYNRSASHMMGCNLWR